MCVQCPLMFPPKTFFVGDHIKWTWSSTSVSTLSLVWPSLQIDININPHYDNVPGVTNVQMMENPKHPFRDRPSCCCCYLLHFPLIVLLSLQSASNLNLHPPFGFHFTAAPTLWANFYLPNSALFPILQNQTTDWG